MFILARPTRSLPRCGPMPRSNAPPISRCSVTPSIRRILSSCAPSSWSPSMWRRRWAGFGTPMPARDGWPDMTDVIDQLAGIAPGSPLDAVRARRPQARLHAQASYDALLKPLSEADGATHERYAIAGCVAGLHARPGILAFYEKGLEDQALKAAIAAAATAARTHGPYGHYPKGPLSAEDRPGPVHRIASPAREALGDRLAAALEH